MGIVDRIQELANEAGLSIAALERATGLSNGLIKKWQNQSPSCDKIITLANYLNTSVEYILLGKQTEPQYSDDVKSLLEYYNKLNAMEKGMVLGKAETLAELASERAAEQEKENKTERNGIGKCLPLSGTRDILYYDNAACAGTGLYLDEASAETLTVRSTPEALAADFAIPIKGDSMEDEFHSGDIVLVESCPCVRKGEVGIFLVDGNVCIKEYNGRFLIPYNKKHKVIDLSSHETVICFGKVIGIAEVVSKRHF